MEDPSLALNCPECGSSSIFKDGVRHLRDRDIQRYLCRDCGYRFSPGTILYKNPPESSNVELNIHGVSECAEKESEKLARSGMLLMEQAKGERKSAELSGAIDDSRNEFADQLRRDGLSNDTIRGCLKFLERIERKGINILNPEQVKGFLADQELSNHTKATYAVYYDLFARAMHIAWNPPRYHYESKIPQIYLEEEYYALINGSGKTMSAFLRLLVETGVRFGEGLRLTWKDLDIEKLTVLVNKPEKNSYCRILPISKTLASILNAMPRKGERIFTGSKNSYGTNFREQRRRISLKLQNPRLNEISFKDFRHFYATMRYARSLNIVQVARDLGHKNINNTMIYTHLVNFKSEEYEVQIAENVDDAKKLGEAGFEHYDTIGERHLYRRRK